MRRFFTLALMCLLLTPAAPVGAASGGTEDLLPAVQRIEADLHGLYRDLHQHPELSQQEEKTAAKMAARLRALGFTVTTGLAGHGVVGVLRNGAGRTLMLRTDLDGLPVREETGLPFASRAQQRNGGGQLVPVMHACGHDLHMTAWIGVATLLSQMRGRWRGTLVMVGQPAEEKGDGARGLLQQGLFTRFPRPDFALAIHDSAEIAAGKVGYTPGFALANVDSVDLTVYGKGGHGAYPHTTVDPIVLASRVVLALQTLVSREKDPLEPAVITVGSFHGGAKHNVIPDEVRLQLTVRSYSAEVRERLLAGIRRVAETEAQGAQAPRPPQVAITEGTPATYNDPALAERVSGALRRALGAEQVLRTPPVMGGEDFSEYGRAGVPSFLFWVGAVPPAKMAGKPAELPSLHSARFAPDYPLALRTAVQGLLAASLDLLR